MWERLKTVDIHPALKDGDAYSREYAVPASQRCVLPCLRKIAEAKSSPQADTECPLGDVFDRVSIEQMPDLLSRDVRR